MTRTLPAVGRRAQLAFAAIMSLCMSVVVTGVASAVNGGFSADFLARWLRAEALAWPIACGVLLTLGPRVRRWVDARFAAGPPVMGADAPRRPS